ncbi:glycine--tRNA ligase subunit beta [Sphingobium phenoxybenzoativorans]|uniref:Glycine--tRNA ligase beta subunit n=1 Tax=Sphingobium phenoxybenzoativorans TaxID=1592790 RepID=A0A975K9K2_9SPHN|nr:glycine--tRNA ligase subunit beta [Sphingobium phenoxybenzoativorans]QUT07328.1 glycine--tRNA ligase subunit beta [Sphingobium phenoxybenzoativorans]
MTDFLLELRCEEIPARMQLKASEDLARLFTEELAKAGLKPDVIDSFVTPRRLALIARGLPLQTEPVSEERKGPRADAPAQALEGFLRSTGLSREQLVERADAKGNAILFAVIEKPGRATSDVLAEAIPAIVRAFPWPKSMRWGKASQTTESLRWVRPLQGIVAILGDDLVEMEIDGVRSGFTTLGHRFHHAGEITIGGAGDYAEKLRACHVIVSHQERQEIIAAKAAEAAESQGYALVEDKGLVAENAGLTEWPVPLIGDFDPAFLEVPPEVIQLTLRVNQKYFVVQEADGKLAPAFICTANIEAKDGGAAIVAGNRKVLAARLSDARFFWEQDRKTPLAEQAKKLERITFHEKLGTVADKVERVAKLARWLVEGGIVSAVGSNPTRGATSVIPAKAGIPLTSPAIDQGSGTLASAGVTKEELADLAEQAARLAKADLVTEMVGEFPELQGVMGGYYARAEGLPDAVADAIRDHYKPVGQGDEVPTAPVTVAVSLADKLDTLLSFFDIKEYPTGSKDPFALRRAALASIRIILDNGLQIHTDAPIEFWLGQTDPRAILSDRDINRRKLLTSIPDFLLDRLSVQLRERGIRHDFVEASRRWDARDDGRLDRVANRAFALQSFISTEDGTNLLAGYKRAANILKKENWGEPETVMADEAEQGIPQTGEEDPFVMVGQPDVADAVAKLGHADPAGALSYTPEPAEAALIAALDAAQPRAAAAVAHEDFEGAMAALATLRAPIDAFFDAVTVNDADPVKRHARLDLLARMRDAVHGVADFSRIEG